MTVGSGVSRISCKGVAWSQGINIYRRGKIWDIHITDSLPFLLDLMPVSLKEIEQYSPSSRSWVSDLSGTVSKAY